MNPLGTIAKWIRVVISQLRTCSLKLIQRQWFFFSILNCYFCILVTTSKWSSVKVDLLWYAKDKSKKKKKLMILQLWPSRNGSQFTTLDETHVVPINSIEYIWLKRHKNQSQKPIPIIAGSKKIKLIFNTTINVFEMIVIFVWLIQLLLAIFSELNNEIRN